MATVLRSAWRLGRITPVCRDEQGAAAVEFALLAPLLAFACLATVDIGLAIGQKLGLDYSLRAASEGAIRDLGEVEVQDFLDAVASEHFAIAADSEDLETQTEGVALTTEVDRFCACPESVSTAVSCSSGTCAGFAKPYLYYRLSADIDYQAILLPDIPLSKSLLVQVK